MSCVLAIQNSIKDQNMDQLPELIHGRPANLNIDLRNSQLFTFKVDTYSDVSFNLLIRSEAAAVTIKIYTAAGVLVSTSNSLTPISTVRTKVERGKYYICFETREFTPVVGTVTMNIDGYTEILPLEDVDFLTGFTCDFVLDKGPKPPIVVDGDICMVIIDGSLPEGIEMDPLGRLSGVAPELDCLEYNDEYSPSNNWKMRDGSKVFSWGRQWNFKVRATICDEKKKADPIEEWFCIKVFNNWNFDRDDFMNAPIREIITREIIEDVQKELVVKDGLCISKCEPEYDVPFIPDSPLFEECASCNEDDISTLPSVFVETLIVPPTLKQLVIDIFDNHTEVPVIHQLLLNLPQFNEDSISFNVKVKRSDVFRTYYNIEHNTDHDISIRLNGSYIELIDIFIERPVEEIRSPYDAREFDSNYKYEQDVLDQLEFDVNKTNPSYWAAVVGFECHFELWDPYGIHAAGRPQPEIIEYSTDDFYPDD